MLHDPAIIGESLAQGASDALDHKGMAYGAGEVGAMVLVSVAGDKGISKAKSVGAAEGVGKASEEMVIYRRVQGGTPPNASRTRIIIDENGNVDILLLEDIESKSEEDLLDLSPVLLINFDAKTLYSMFPEPESYEEYVPKGWSGKYGDFTELIPKTERYWIDKINCNLFLL